MMSIRDKIGNNPKVLVTFYEGEASLRSRDPTSNVGSSPCVYDNGVHFTKDGPEMLYSENKKNKNAKNLNSKYYVY